MTENSTQGATETDAEANEKPGALAFFRLAGGYWTGPARGLAFTLAAAVTLLSLAEVGVQLLVNGWNKSFFDALEKKDVGLVWQYVLLFLPIIALSAIVVTTYVVVKMTFQMRWREWLTHRLLGWWISDQRYYRMTIAGGKTSSAPEYRISDDIRLAIEPLVDFAIGLLTAAATAISFSAVLWTVGGSATVQMGATQIVVPAYMAVAAVIYAVIVSTASYIVGRPLAGKVADKNEIEAVFRSEMTRLRENAESIALIRGDEEERKSVGDTYGRVVESWKAVIRRQGIIGVVLNTHGAIFSVVPLFLIAPKYLTGEVTLGAVMQVTSAFMAVQSALIWFVDNVVRLAEWYASAQRVNELASDLRDIDRGERLEGESNIEIVEGDDDALHLDNLSIAHTSGRVVISSSSESIQKGERVLVVGESGTGKSTLVRAIAGLWPWGAGKIALPKGDRLAFLPQKPYIPLGGLRAILAYPDDPEKFSDDEFVAAMDQVGLHYLAKHLDEENEWDKTLSGGERQRIAFARLLLQKPEVIVMDEATSALDEESQARVMSLLTAPLGGATVISVAHRSGLEEYHTRKISLERHEAGARMSSVDVDGPLYRVLRKLRQEVFGAP